MGSRRLSAGLARAACAGGLLLALLFGAVGAAHAALLLQGNELKGATNVQINGQYYDVDFREGSCAGVFGTCAQASFFFQTQTSAEDAAKALMQQVFQNGPQGNFDTQSNLTFGCEPSQQVCVAMTPYDTGQVMLGGNFVPGVRYAGANNADFEASDETTSFNNEGFAQSLSTQSNAVFVWAYWSDAANPPRDLPEPGSLAASALALAALLALRRRGSSPGTAYHQG